MDNIKTKKDKFIADFKQNPAWFWLLFTVFSFFLLPEYISPFILFAVFIVFKRQWTKEGRLAKVGNIGKLEMGFMGYMLLSVLWSPTKLDTLGCAGLWWGMFLIQVMIFNLAKTKEKIKKLLTALVIPAAVNGLLGSIQLVTYALFLNGRITKDWVLITPFYSSLDIKVYSAMPFKISTDVWRARASGFFSNPNLLATFMLAVFPIGIYLFLNASSKKSKFWYFIALVCMTLGMASTLTRAGCYILIAAWIVMFIIYCKRQFGSMLLTAVPTFATAVTALLIRYSKIIIYPRLPSNPGATEAIRSSEAHFAIWESMIDYIVHHWNVFLFGTGFGCEHTGNVLLQVYNLKKPHSHNFIIEIWVELGLVGILMLGFLIVYAFGKLLEINTKDFKSLSIVVTLMTGFFSYLIFGLSDYIFNSPKQIILIMIFFGLIQAVSQVYDKKEIKKPSDVGQLAKEDVLNIINQ